VKRREMLRKGVRDLAQILPLALAATGGLSRLLYPGAGCSRPREVASFPAGKREADGQAKALNKEEV
jgi:hypothetical protein